MTNNETNLNQSDSQAVLNKIVLEYLREQKRKRFWRWVTRVFFVVLFMWSGVTLS